MTNPAIAGRSELERQRIRVSYRSPLMIPIPSSIVSDDDPNFRLDGHATGLGRDADHSIPSRLAQLTWCDHSMICAGRKVQIAHVVDVISGVTLGIHLRFKPDADVVVGALDRLTQQAKAKPL